MTKPALLRCVRIEYLLLTATCLTLITGCGGPRSQQGAGHPAVGQPLLFLELEPLTGGGAAITQDSLKGRVTLMNFWATWCGPCRIEFPHMATLVKKLESEPRFQFISVNTDDETPEEARILATKFLLEQQVSHPTWTDSTRATWGGLAQQIGAGGIPLTLVFDSQGVIRGIWNGYQRGDEVAMEALVRELLQSSK